MRRSHLGSEGARGILLVSSRQRRNNSGSIRRMHLGETDRADNAMRQKNRFGNAAGPGSLLKRPQHQWRDRQIGGRGRPVRHRKRDPVPAHPVACAWCRRLLDKREQVPHLKRVKRRDISCSGSRGKAEETAPGPHIRRRQRIGESSWPGNADQHAKLAGKSLIGRQRLCSTFKFKGLACQFGIERRHHLPGPAGDIRIHHRRHKSQAAR